jgi:hypothetical protein
MHPDLRLDAGELPIEGLGQELEIAVLAVRLDGAPVVRRFLDLDQRTAGVGDVAELRVHDVAEIEDHRAVVDVELVPQHRRQRRRADRAELHRPVGHPLCHFPELGIFERAARQLPAHHARLIRLLDLPQDLARAQVMAGHPAARGVAMALDPAEALDRIEEPRLAAHRQVEAAVAVGHDVEPGRFLFGDDAGDRVEVLLAEQRIAQRRPERSPVQAAVEP